MFEVPAYKKYEPHSLLKMVVIICSCCFCVFMPMAVANISYGYNHYYTATELEVEKEKAYMFCSTDPCIVQRNNYTECQDWNAIMDTEENFDVDCSTVCGYSGCGVIQSTSCLKNCVKLWAWYKHVERNTGIDGREKYALGMIFLFTAVGLVISMMTGVWYTLWQTEKTLEEWVKKVKNVIGEIKSTIVRQGVVSSHYLLREFNSKLTAYCEASRIDYYRHFSSEDFRISS